MVGTPPDFSGKTVGQLASQSPDGRRKKDGLADGRYFGNETLLVALSPGRGKIRRNHVSQQYLHLFLFPTVDVSAEILVEIRKPTQINHFVTHGLENLFENRRPGHTVGIIGHQYADDLIGLHLFPHADVGGNDVLFHRPEGMKGPVVRTAFQPGFQR